MASYEIKTTDTAELFLYGGESGYVEPQNLSLVWSVGVAWIEIGDCLLHLCMDIAANILYTGKRFWK